MRLPEMTGLRDFANLHPQMLSGGMKQRTAFCRKGRLAGSELTRKQPTGR